jgi:hypothetical protein
VFVALQSQRKHWHCGERLELLCNAASGNKGNPTGNCSCHIRAGHWQRFVTCRLPGTSGLLSQSPLQLKITARLLPCAAVFTGVQAHAKSLESRLATAEEQNAALLQQVAALQEQLAQQRQP